MENSNNFKNREGGRVIAGLILVGVGAALLLRNTGFPMPYWLFSWPVILILVGIYSGFKHNFRNNTWLILIIIGGFFLADRVIPDLRLAPYFWPLFIIAMGLLFIVRPRRYNTFSSDNDGTWRKDPGGTWQKGNSETISTDSNDYIRVNSVFSGVKKNIVSKSFKGGQITSVFGGSEIDLSQADINGKVQLKFEVVFGGAKIIVPSHWSITNNIDGVFHGVDDKRRSNLAVTIDPGKELILTGSVVFGGVEIRSY